MSGYLGKAGARFASADDAMLEYSVEQPQDSVAGDFFFIGELAQPPVDGKADESGAHRRLRRGISDFAGAIRHHGRHFSTRESVRRHRAARHFIEGELARAELAGERVVVITHHAPSRRSVRRWFRGDPLNPAFASDPDRLIERWQPALWIHGHMHDPVDERLGKTRLVANPAGYPHERKRGFDPALCIDLDAAGT